MNTAAAISQLLDKRRQELGMSHAVVSARSKVSIATVQRVLTGSEDDPGIATVAAIAGALGLGLDPRCETGVDAMREQQARSKAERLVGMVQGSAALEGQAVDAGSRERMVQQTVHELLAGSPRRLWAA